MKFDFIHYIRYSRYRPQNLIESCLAQLKNFLYIKKSKNLSFHILRYKNSPPSTRYYNKIGRLLIILTNFLSITLFNKLLIKNLGLQNEVYSKRDIGDNFSHWPLTPRTDYLNKKLKNEHEIEKKINLQYEYSLKKKNQTDLPFWAKNRSLFKKNFFDNNGNIILKKLENFRNSNIEFSSNLLLNKNIEDLKTRYNKLKALKIFTIYHKVAELVDDDIIINISDNNIGNTKFIHYRNQLINERILRQAYFFSQIRKLTNLDKKGLNIFCDIGPGYGLLTSILKKEFSRSNFILVDLPEMNILSYYFLKNLFPKSNICLSHEIENDKIIDKELINNYDFMILEQDDLKRLDDNIVDCSINTASLGEMSKFDQDYYVDQIERITNKYFYSVNRHRSDNIHFSNTKGYYDFKFKSDNWIIKLYKFSPTFHIEVLLEKNN